MRGEYGIAGLATVSLLGMTCPNEAFAQMLTTFGLAGIVGTMKIPTRHGPDFQATTQCGA